MNPEIDKIASAAIDGEATQAELTQWADDPNYVDARAQLSSAAELVNRAGLPQPPAGLAQSQISVAMEEFRAQAANTAVVAADPGMGGRGSAKPQRASWGIPRWLTPALFSLAILGGVGFALSNQGDSDSATSGNESALVAASSSDEAGATAEEMQQSDLSDATMQAAPRESAATTAADGALDSVTPDSIDLANATFFSNRSLAASDIANSATPPKPPLDPDTYDRCGPANGYFPPPGRLVQVIVFTYGTDPAELLVYENQDSGEQMVQILNNLCEVLSQS